MSNREVKECVDWYTEVDAPGAMSKGHLGWNVASMRTGKDKEIRERYVRWTWAVPVRVQGSI
jgi:hypothetical protein